MKLPIHQVSAFARGRFTGNPAAVVLLAEWLPEATMQAIAAENNLSETAFLVGGDQLYEIRWFTPTIEVKLCGHATLASGWVVLNRLEPEAGSVEFASQSGPLVVKRAEDRLVMDFPAHPVGVLSRGFAEAVRRATSLAPAELHQAGCPLAVYRSASEIRQLRIDPAPLVEENTGLIVTAPGDEPGVDFVSRFFAPHAGILEDPVTGSAHCGLTPYWSERLGRESLFARQLSARGGDVWCRHRGDRVELGGRVEPFLEGMIEVPGQVP